jgi:hypothetical protein
LLIRARKRLWRVRYKMVQETGTQQHSQEQSHIFDVPIHESIEACFFEMIDSSSPSLDWSLFCHNSFAFDTYHTSSPQSSNSFYSEDVFDINPISSSFFFENHLLDMSNSMNSSHIIDNLLEGDPIHDNHQLMDNENLEPTQKPPIIHSLLPSWLSLTKASIKSTDQDKDKKDFEDKCKDQIEFSKDEIVIYPIKNNIRKKQSLNKSSSRIPEPKIIKKRVQACNRKRVQLTQISDDPNVQIACCLSGCDNAVTNRLRFSLRKNHTFKEEFLEKGWNKVCQYHYFSDLYKAKTESKRNTIQE